MNIKIKKREYREKLFVLGIIPARGGSKGIPGKNMNMFSGKPLVDWTIDIAVMSNLDAIIATTENEEIKKHFEEKRISVIDRPKNLAKDDTPMLPVIQHALKEFTKEHGVKVDAICLLQPTSPLRSLKTINACIEVINSDDDIKSVTTVYDGVHPKKSYNVDGSAIIKTSEPYDRHKNRILTRSGSVFVTRTEYIEKGLLLYKPKLYRTDKLEAIDIDEYCDWIMGVAVVEHLRNINKERNY